MLFRSHDSLSVSECRPGLGRGHDEALGHGQRIVAEPAAEILPVAAAVEGEGDVLWEGGGRVALGLGVCLVWSCWGCLILHAYRVHNVTKTIAGVVYKLPYISRQIPGHVDYMI